MSVYLEFLMFLTIYNYGCFFFFPGGPGLHWILVLIVQAWCSKLSPSPTMLGATQALSLQCSGALTYSRHMLCSWGTSLVLSLAFSCKFLGFLTQSGTSRAGDFFPLVIPQYFFEMHIVVSSSRKATGVPLLAAAGSLTHLKAFTHLEPS